MNQENSDESASILNKLIKIIALHWFNGKRRDVITGSAQLVKDLKIYGDDLDEFLEVIEREFQISFSESGFDFSAYFPGEPHIFSFFTEGTKLPFSVEDLAKLIEKCQKNLCHEPDHAGK